MTHAEDWLASHLHHAPPPRPAPAPARPASQTAHVVYRLSPSPPSPAAPSYTPPPRPPPLPDLLLVQLLLEERRRLPQRTLQLAAPPELRVVRGLTGGKGAASQPARCQGWGQTAPAIQTPHDARTCADCAWHVGAGAMHRNNSCAAPHHVQRPLAQQGQAGARAGWGRPARMLLTQRAGKTHAYTRCCRTDTQARSGRA